jgi:hypothetical protein
VKPVDSEASRLLAKIIATGQSDVATMARVLVTDERTIGRYLAGDLAMPAARQLCLAQFLVNDMPGLAREGHRLLGRVQARIRFESGETVVHNDAPPSRF